MAEVVDSDGVDAAAVGDGEDCDDRNAVDDIEDCNDNDGDSDAVDHGEAGGGDSETIMVLMVV